jgi:hypothetical protein
MNSMITSNIIRIITTGKANELLLMKSVIHPNHGTRITLPSIRFPGEERVGETKGEREETLCFGHYSVNDGVTPFGFYKQ